MYYIVPYGECKVPKEGFKSITVSETVYNRFSDTYARNKKALEVKGIRSLSGYVSYMLEERMQENEALARHAPLLEKISVDDDRIVLLDKAKNRVAEVTVQNGALFCQLCEETDCLHVGYAFALPEVYDIMSAHGIKRPV